MANLNPYREATRELFQTVEHYLYHYQRLKREVEEYELSCLGSSAEPNGGIRGSFLPDPSARGGVALADPPHRIKVAKRWIKVIDDAREEMGFVDRDMVTVLETYYGLNLANGRHRRDAAKVALKLMDDLHVGKTTFYRKRNDCVELVKMLAIRAGLINPGIKKPAPTMRQGR